MASWEFPPLVVGGLAAHVDGLTRALVRQGHEVVVLTLHHDDVPDDDTIDGVRVLRARAARRRSLVRTISPAWHRPTTPSCSS